VYSPLVEPGQLYSEWHMFFIALVRLIWSDQYAVHTHTPKFGNSHWN